MPKTFKSYAYKLCSKLFGFALITLPLISPAQSATNSEPVVANLHVGEEIRHLDPQLSTALSSSHIAINMFETLYEYGHKKGAPVKALAVSHKTNKDASVWTFKIRNDVFWVKNEGGKIKKMRKLVANDFVYAYERILNPKTASQYASMLNIIKNAEAYNQGKLKDPKKIGVKALDDTTLQLTLRGPLPSLIQYLPHHTFTAVPREPIEKHKEKWIKKENIWTNGTYAFDGWKLKERIMLVKNPHHPDAANVQIDKANFHFIGTNSPEAVRAFRAGKIDIDYGSPPVSELKPLIRSKNLQAAKGLGTYFVRVNVTRKPFDNPKVRKALALVIPRKRIVKYVTKKGEQPTSSFVPSTITAGYKTVPFTNEKDYKKRVAEAKKLLAEAGFPNGKGFPKFKYLYNTSESHQKIAQVITQAWKKELGINATLANQEWKVFLNTQSALDYDVSRSGWVADMADPMNFLDMFTSTGGNNDTGYKNKEYDELIRQAQVEGNTAKRNKMMEKIEGILMRDLPVLPIYNYVYVNLTQKYVSGFYANKMSQHTLRHVKIDTAKRKKLFPKLYK